MRLFLCLAIIFILSVASRSIGGPEPSAETVLSHVNVVDVDSAALLRDMNVHLKRGRIVSVRPSKGDSIARGVRVIDLTGRFLVPGFVEMHAHLLLHPWDASGRIMSNYDRPSVLDMLKVLLAHGVTTVRDPGAPTKDAIRLRSEVSSGNVIGPRVFTAGRILTAGAGNPEPFVTVTTEQEVRKEVRTQTKAGVDFIKVYASMPPELVKVAVEEAHGRGTRVIGHLQRTNWGAAAEIGVDAICHAAPWSAEYLSPSVRESSARGLMWRAHWLKHLDLQSSPVRSMVEALARHQVAMDPTLIAMHTKFWGNDPRYTDHSRKELAPRLHWKGWPKGSFTSGWTDEDYREARAQWPKLLAFNRLMYKRGCLLTVGTDTPSPWIIPGISFHEELDLLASAGIPPKDLLRMATVNGAKAVGREKEIGRIRAGMRADLVVLRANPLVKIGNARQIEMVIAEGRIRRPRDLLAGRARSSPVGADLRGRHRNSP
jgi:imidazolonepropionase-like amidohydrolase